jgi:glyoxylase-like metal-dependent hydrolase (beta-lactamase superfamily II)
LDEVVRDGVKLPQPWKVRVFVSGESMGYLAINESTREALIVDPVREDLDQWLAEAKKLEGYRFVAVIDTATHMGHVSCAARLAGAVQAPYMMNKRSFSSRVQFRVSGDVSLSTQAGPLDFLETPGHTADSIVLIWGPMIFTGQTVTYGDTGRNDLPTGNHDVHWDSLQKVKVRAKGEMIFLPSGDSEGGRASAWSTQLRENQALGQARATYVREALARSQALPDQFREALVENFR